MARNRRFLTVLIGWAGFSLFFAAWLQFQWGGGEVTQRFDNLGETLAALVAAAVCGIAARRHQRRTRIAWALIGASALSWGVGQAIWSYYELVVGQQVPFPSFADLGFLGAVPLAVAQFTVTVKSLGADSVTVEITGVVPLLPSITATELIARPGAGSLSMIVPSP